MNENKPELRIVDVPADFLIKTLKDELKEIEIVDPPSWSNFVKTGTHKEKPPMQDDWWYIRAAAILRRVYLEGPIGVQKLRKYYGGLKRRGVRPGKKVKAGGKIIRKILQQLEAADLVIKVRQGRKINSKGRNLLSEVASRFSQENNASISL